MKVCCKGPCRDPQAPYFSSTRTSGCFRYSGTISSHRLQPSRAPLGALRHRATLADWLRRWQGHRVHSWDGDRQGYSELSPSPPASITGVPAPALAVCLRHSSSKNILATPAGGSCLQSSTRHQGYNGRNLVLPSASHACSLAGRDLSCTTGQFRSPSPPPPLALRLFLCYVGLNHGQYLRPSKHNAA